ncbi:MAG TPA: hypothetical protein VK651_05575, partial [Blastocatellia bacterium]|nr:hypothetical protein [Blastocatellia bacterium]
METRIEQPGLLSAGGVLDRIVEAKAGRLDEAKRRAPMAEVAAKALSLAALPGERSLVAALRRRDRVNVIAEIKQRSPSKGIICEDFDPVRI